MRMLAGYDIFYEPKPHYFENTELSLFLTKNHPDSFRDSVIYRIELGSESWSGLLYSLKTGKPAFDKIFGMPFFQYLIENPEKSKIFNNAMVAQYRKVFHNVLDIYDFSSCNVLIDIGGGKGSFVSMFLQKYHNAHAVLFDLQSAIKEFDTSIYDENIMSRLKLKSGDFFESVPEGGDVYFLKTVIHDWDDEHAVKILQNVVDKMAPHSRLLLIETIVPEKNSQDFSFLMDIQMLVQHGGRERSKTEYENLLKRADCKLKKIYNLSGMFHIIEATLT